MRKLSWLWMVPPVIVVLFLSWQMRRYQVDDALIYLRYVRNFINGNGFVYNPGELFNGMTSPLFSYLLLATGWVFRQDLTIVGAMVSGAGMIATVLLAGKLFSKNPIEAGITATGVAMTGYFYRTYGLETTLSLALLTGLLLLVQRKSAWIFPLGALAVLARAETAFLVLPVGIYYFASMGRLPKLAYLGTAVGIFVTPFIVNWVSYGAPIPGTAAAKFGQGASGYWGGPFAFLQADYLMGWVFSGQVWALAVLGGLAVFGAVLVRKDPATWMVLIYLVGLGSFYLATNMPNYHWYYAPFIYFLLVFAGTGLGRLATTAFRATGERRWMAAVTAGAVVIASPFAFAQLTRLPTVRGLVFYQQAGTWLKEHTPPTASVAATEIGTIGWYSNRRIVDILGLVNEHNAEYIAQRDVYSWLYHSQPDYVLCHQPTWQLEASCDLLEQQHLYRAAVRFTDPNLVILERIPGITDQQVIDTVRATRPR